MTQKIPSKLWEEFQLKQQEKEKEREGKSIVNNGERHSSGITSQIAQNIRISDLASEHNITKCPSCDYDIYFDDTNGFFCCQNARWTGKKECDFAGNIVTFAKFLEDRLW